MGGAPALAGHNTACGGVFSGVVSKIFAVKKMKKKTRRPASSPVFHGFLGVLEGGVCSVSQFQPWGDITNRATARSTTILRIWRRCAISRRSDFAHAMHEHDAFHRCLHARHPLL